MQEDKIEQMISQYASSTVDATSLLYDRGLYGQLLVILYAAIDTMGLLDAPAGQVTASGKDFQNWVTKYILAEPGVEFTAVDLWAARCGVLHTFTTDSNLAREGKARQLQYFGGDKSSQFAKNFVNFTRALDGGKHLPVHFEDLYLAVLSGIRRFVHDLDAKCRADSAYEARVRNVLQTVQVPGNSGP